MAESFAVINDYFLPFFQSEEKIQILYGGAGSGKSVAVMQKIVKICLEEEGTRVLATRKFLSSIRESIFKTFKTFIIDHGMENYVKINNTDMSFHFPN